jgi:hypothetical protein
MDKRELLKSMLTHYIQDRNEEAHDALHSYLTTKFQEVSGMSNSREVDFVENDLDVDLDDNDHQDDVNNF